MFYHHPNRPGSNSGTIQHKQKQRFGIGTMEAVLKRILKIEERGHFHPVSEVWRKLYAIRMTWKSIL
jgi:hypothetical protein